MTLGNPMLERTPKSRNRRLRGLIPAGSLRLAAWVALLAAGAACGRSSAKPPRDQAEFHYQLGNNAFYEKNPMQAIQELHTALELDPEHKEAHHLLGFIYFGREEYDEAVSHFQRALEIDPKYFEARSNLGAVLLAQRRWQEAVDALTPLATERLYPTPHLLHNNLGWALFHLGDHAGAEDHFKTAIFLKPQMCLAHNNLGQLYAAQQRLDLAVRAFDRAIAKCADYQEPYYHLGTLYAATGQAEAAAKSFARCVELGPETPLGTECEQLSRRAGGGP